MRIWVTTIISGSSHQLWNTAHTSEEEARDSVLDYVKGRWEHYNEEPMPEDRDEAIEAWFEDYDQYTIEQVILDYKPRVLIFVTGGIADWETDPGVEVAKIDLDDWEAEDDAERREYKENLVGFEDLIPTWIEQELEEI
jgi:hypothetical protein